MASSGVHTRGERPQGSRNTLRNPRIRRRHNRLFQFNRPDVNVARLYDEDYVYQIYERVFASSANQNDNRRRYDSTPIESEWLTEEIYHFSHSNCPDTKLADDKTCNGTYPKRQAVEDAISSQVNRIISEVLHGVSTGRENHSFVGSRNTSQRPQQNSLDGLADVNTFGSSQNSSCFLEKQLLLVRRAQEMLLEEYRLGNHGRMQNNRTVSRGSDEINKHARESQEDSDSIHDDPSLDDAASVLQKAESLDVTEPRDEVDAEASVDSTRQTPDFSLTSFAVNSNSIASQQSSHRSPDIEYKPGSMDHLPVNAQIGIKLFFRLLRTLRFDRNPRVLAKVIQQIPKLLANMPPLALANDGADPSATSRQTHARSAGVFDSSTQKSKNIPNIETQRSTSSTRLGIVDALSNALEETVLARMHKTKIKTTSKGGPESSATMQSSNVDQSPPPSEENVTRALASIVGLAIKRGSLSHILNAVLLVLSFDDGGESYKLPVGQYLKELAEAKHAEVEALPELGNAKGMLMTFGKGDHGKLGHGKCTHAQCSDGNCTENKNVPSIVESLQNTRITLIDSLSTHSVAVTTDGILYTWGNGDKHRLGHGTTSKEYLPRPVQALSEKPAVVDVACGLGHTIALLANGEVYSWGNGGNGRLGHGDTQDRSSASIISMLEGVTVVSVYSGASHSLAISEDGVCLSWGKNNQGQCGHGNMTDHLLPLPIASFQNQGEFITQVSGGWEHTLAISRDGNIFSFGSGYKDSRRDGLPPVLGHGGNERKLTPEQILTLQDESIVHIACGWDHSLAVSAEGLLYTWGAGTNGKLGHGDENDKAFPTCVEALRGQIVVQAEAGCEHSVALTSNGELYTWGHGDSGRLGHGETKSENKPRKLQLPRSKSDNNNESDSSLKVLSIAVGDKYNMIIVDDFEKDKSNAHKTDSEAHAEAHAAERQRKDCDYRTEIEPNGHNDKPMSSQWILSRKIFSLQNLLEDSAEPSSQLAMLFPSNMHINTNLNLIRNDNNNIMASHLPVIVMAHLERLVKPFHGNANGAFGKMLNGSSFISSTASKPILKPRVNDTTPRFAYCIEATEETLSYFYLILIHCFQNYKNSEKDHELCRWCIVLCTLRLLRANMQQLVSIKSKNAPANSKAPAKQESAPNFTFSHVSPKMIAVFNNLHNLLLQIIKNPISSEAVDKDIRKGKDGSRVESPKFSGGVIEREAADVIRVGFDFFYPSPASRKTVLRQFMEATVPNQVLLTAVMDRLSENAVVAHLMRNILPNDMVALGVKDDLNIAPGSLTPDGVDKLLNDILKRVQLQMYDKLEVLTHHSTTKAYDSKMMSNSPYTKLLLAMQNHIVAAWSHIARHNADPFVSDDIGNINKCVALHGKRLLETSVECYTKCHEIICSKIKLTPSRVDSIRDVMSQSFLSTILIPFIAGLSVSPAHMSLATQLLPSLLPLVEIIDKVNCKLMLVSNRNKDKVNNRGTFLSNLFDTKSGGTKHCNSGTMQSLEHSWETRIHALMVHFTGKLIMLIIKGTPFTATEAALERWLSSRLLSGGIQHVDDIDKKDGNRGPSGIDVVMDWKRQSMFSLEAGDTAILQMDDGANLQNQFLKDLLHGNGDADNLNILLEESILSVPHNVSPLSPSGKSSTKMREASVPPEILAGQRVLRALASVILKFNGYVTEAMSQTKLLCMSRTNHVGGDQLSNTLLDVWETALFLQRLAAIQERLNNAEKNSKKTMLDQIMYAIDATPARNVLPTSESTADTVVRHCVFLLGINPAFNIQLVKHGNADVSLSKSNFFSVSRSVVSLQELFEFVSQPMDIAILRNEILGRIRRAKVRSIGLDLTNYLLTIISPTFGYVKAQAITQLPYALARPSIKATSHNAIDGGSRDINVELTRATHYSTDLQSCGSQIASLVHSSFILLYERLCSGLIDENSTQDFKLAIMHSWALKVESQDHLRISKLAALQITSPKHQAKKGNSTTKGHIRTLDAFGGGLLLPEEEMLEESYDHSMSNLCSNLVTVLGKLLETDGDILNPSLYEGRITQAGGSVINLHHTIWRIFYLLGIQLSQSSDPREERHTDDSSYSMQGKHPLYSVIVHELQRVCCGLDDIALNEISFTHLARKTRLSVVIPNKIWMTRDQPGVVIPVCPVVHGKEDDNAGHFGSNTFAVSLWLRLPKHGNTVESNDKADNRGNIFDFRTGNRGKSNFHHRHVVCARTETVKVQDLGPGETSVTRDSDRSNNKTAHVFYPAIFLSYGKTSDGNEAMPKDENAGKLHNPFIEFVVTTLDKKKGEYINNVVASSETLVRGQWTHVACVYDGNKGEMGIYINGISSAATKTQGCPPQYWSKPLHIGAPQHGMYADTRAALVAVDGSHGLIGWVSSLWWFDSALGNAEAKALSNYASPNTARLKNEIDNYGYRLITLCLVLIKTKKGSAGLLENSECLTNMLTLLRTASGKVQRCILAFLKQSLPLLKPLDVQVPTMPVTVGSGLKAAKASRTASGLWKYLSDIIGITWFCDDHEAKKGLSGLVNSVLSQYLPELFRNESGSHHYTSSVPGIYAQLASCNNRIGFNSLHSKKSLVDRTALVAELVSLFRRLLVSNHWGGVISECMTTSLDQFSDFLLNKLELTKPNEGRKVFESFEWSLNRGIVVGALSAIYVLGGLVDRPYVGARVCYPSRHEHSVDFVGATVSAEEECTGIIIDINCSKQNATIATTHGVSALVANKDQKLSPSYRTFSIPLSVIKVANLDVPQQLYAALSEKIVISFLKIVQIFLGVNPELPVPSFTMSAQPAGANSTLPWVCSNVISISRGKQRKTSNGPNVSNSTITQHNVILCFMRARVLRALSSVLSHASAAKHLIKSGCLPRLLRASVTNVSKAASSAALSIPGMKTDIDSPNTIFGQFRQNSKQSDPKSVPVYVHTHAFASELSKWISVPIIEKIAEEAFGRLHSGESPLPTEVYKCMPRIGRMGGKIKIYSTINCVKSVSNFPSIKLTNLCLYPAHNVSSIMNIKKRYPPGAIVGGCFYYEVILLSDGLMQIGWADALYKGDPERGQGVGDHPHSWALDGYRCKKWNSSSSDYGVRWHNGDVVGCLINLDALQMRFTVNGKDLGIAYNTIHSVGGLYPAASFNMHQAARFNFGPPHSDFIHSPPSGYESIGTALGRTMVNSQRNECASSENASDLNTFDTKIKSSILEPSPSPEVAIQRQDLVDNLITMGFPLEWCVRVANVQQNPIMDESAAIAWIIERMEEENASHDADGLEAQNSSSSINENINSSRRNGGGVYNASGDKGLTSEDDDDNDEDENDDSLQQISNVKPMLGATSSLELCNDSSVGNTTNYEDHAHLLDDEECTEIYASMPDQYFPSLTASNIFNSASNVVTGLAVSGNATHHGSANESSNGINSGSLMSLLNGTTATIDNNNDYQALNDAYSAQSILPKVISLLSQPDGDVSSISTSNNNNRVREAPAENPLHELGNSDDQQELWAISLSTSCALSTIYARSSVLSILQHVSDVRNDKTNVIDVKGDLGVVLRGPQCILMFVDFLKLVRFRGPLPQTLLSNATPKHPLYFADELHFLLKPIFKILLSTRSTFSPDASEEQKPSAASLASKQSSNSPLFLTVLVDEALGHFTRARARQYDKMAWISRPIPQLHPFVSSIITLTCDNDSLVQPNPIWAAWTLNIIMDEMENLNIVNSGQSITSTQDINSVSNEIFGVGALSTVLRAAFTPNMSLKDILFRIAGRILNHCVATYPKYSSSSQKHWRWMTTAKALLGTVHEHRLIRVFTSRYRKEREQSILFSPYLHSLTALLLVCAQVRGLIYGEDTAYMGPAAENKLGESDEPGSFTFGPTSDGNPADTDDSPTTSDTNINAQLQSLKAPNVIIDEIGVSSVSLAWCLKKEDVASKLQNDQTVKVEISVAEVPQPFSNSKAATPQSSAVNTLAFKRLEVQNSAPVMDYGGFGVRPRTLSTITCNDVEADSRYAFRVEMDILDESNEVQHTIVGAPSFVDTKPENLFMLDPSACGANLVLSNSNMTVTNGVNKKWNAVRASTCFSNGVHYWEVHIDKCISKNIFVGIMTANGSTDNYVGSDRDGWGYLANKAIWHNKGKMCTYGELFREGDRIGVTLDMDCGTVSFNRNGKDLGIGVEGVSGEVYPAFSLYNIEDQISLIPTGSTTSSRIGGKKSAKNFNASKGAVIPPNSFSLARVLLQTLHETIECFTSLLQLINDHAGEGSLIISSRLENEVSGFAEKWARNEIARHRNIDGESILVDTSVESSRAYGFLPGEIVHTPKGEFKVLGVSRNSLWNKATTDGTVDCWSRKACRELRMTMGPKSQNTPVTTKESTNKNNTEKRGRLNFSELIRREDVFAMIGKLVSMSSEPWVVPYDMVEEEHRELAALLLVLNYRLEPLLPLVELWCDGYALSASGLTPRVSLHGLYTSDAPPIWSYGNAILQCRKLIFPWTKYHLLLSVMEQTSSGEDAPKIRLTLSHGTLNLASIYRQLGSTKNECLRRGIEFIIGRSGDKSETQAQDSCFEIIVTEINKEGVTIENAYSVGLLLGVAIRTGNSFPLDLPQVAWGYLCQPIKVLDNSVAPEDIHKYQKTMQALRQGMMCIIPGYVLPLFTGQEFKDLVCGSVP